jgi:DNA polymerase-3 subunit beta
VLFAIRPSRRALLAELSLALSIPPHKFGSAVETHVLLDSTAGVGRISLQATNFDESFESTFNAQVDVLGRVALPTRKLHDYLRQLPDGDITISASEPHVIIVRSGRSMTRFTGLDPDAFPSAKPVREPIFHFPAEILAAVLRRTRFAISSEDSRYVLKCLLLSLGPEHTRVVSTDGNRLTLIEMPSV